MSDDFAQIEWAASGGVWELFRPHASLYRPLQSLLYRLIHRFFGLTPVPYHVLSLLTHTGSSLLLFWLVVRLTGAVPKGLLCASIFGLHFIHVEPVVWISSLNILMATCLMLSALLLLRSRSVLGRTVSVLLSVLALLSSEAGLVMPLLVLVTLWAGHPGDDRSVRSSIPYFAMSGAYIIWRIPWYVALGQEGAYAFVLGANVLKNLSFLATSMFFRLDYPSILATWNSHGKGIGALLNVPAAHPLAASLVLVSFVAIALMVWRSDRVARSGAIFLLCAALPILFLVGTGERLTYLPSAGFALLAGLTVFKLRRHFVALVGIAACVYLFAVAFLDLDRWIVASRISQTVTQELAQIVSEHPQVDTVYVSGLPDNHRGAYLFRGGIGSAARLLSGRRVTVTKTDERVGTEPHATQLYVEYSAGRLVMAGGGSNEKAP